jgi:D-serine deaminase-like pyridoxal phosphate-dependent protein
MVRSLDGPLAVGDRLTFVPIHVCTCVNLADRLHAVRGDTVVDVWPVDARGRTA